MKPIKIEIKAKGRVGPSATWRCVRCGRSFVMSPAAEAAADHFSLCITCFAEECTELPDEGVEDLS